MNPILLAGPTASGKSAVALEMAERMGGEILSVDSMQVYRGMDIGTSKPSADDRARVPHHLLDRVGLEESFDAARFVAEAGAAVLEVNSRGHLPILCGGTGLYFNAWLNGLGSTPPPDPALRTELESLSTETLLDELARKDWETFDAIDLKNRRRLVRAVEVIRITGLPFSRQRAAWPERAPGLTGRAFGLRRSREDLVGRIHRRVDQMFEAGLVEETRRLLEIGLGENRTAMQAIGYRQVVEHLRGQRGLRETIELVKIRTRQYAKRQMTWFEGQLDLEWIQVAPAELPEVTAEKLIQHLSKSTCPKDKSPTA
jgi:tRNA dimethylallyltransferase